MYHHSLFPVDQTFRSCSPSNSRNRKYPIICEKQQQQEKKKHLSKSDDMRLVPIFLADMNSKQILCHGGCLGLFMSASNSFCSIHVLLHRSSTFRQTMGAGVLNLRQWPSKIISRRSLGDIFWWRLPPMMNVSHNYTAESAGCDGRLQQINIYAIKSKFLLLNTANTDPPRNKSKMLKIWKSFFRQTKICSWGK